MAKKLPPLTRHAVTAPTEDQGTRLAGARMLPLNLLVPNPWQPRQHVDAERMQELIADISTRGILEPIIVRPTDEGKYEVVAGERRYRAAVSAELTAVPVIVREDMSEEAAREASLVENLLREDLDVEDEARFLKALYEQKNSLRAVGEAIHKSYQYVNRRLKLLEDPQALLAYREGRINLDYLISGRSLDHEDVELEGASAVTERNSFGEPSDNEDSNTAHQGAEGEGVTLRNSVDNQQTSNNLEKVSFYRTRSTFKPFHKLQLHVRRIEARSIQADERPILRQAVKDLIAELGKLEKELEEVVEDQINDGANRAVPDIELEEREDGRPGLIVKRAESS